MISSSAKPDCLPEPDSALSDTVLDWYAHHGRQFPWRQIDDPYHLLCVEIMLQRTRASQVVPVFDRFRERFRRPRDLVGEGKEAAKALFEGLGLHWRADHFWNLHQYLVETADGEIPETYEELKQLPGVGTYVASAVCVFAYGESLTVLDSNTMRVLGRYFGVEFSTGARRSQRILDWAARLAPAGSEKSKQFNWALIDIGALLCRPAIPDCQSCPLFKTCKFPA